MNQSLPAKHQAAGVPDLLPHAATERHAYCRYVACMNPTAGSFVVNPRLQRLFMTLAVEFPGQESLMKIYGTFVTGHLKKFSADVQVC